MSEVKPDFEAIAMAHARTNYSGTATSDYVMKVSFHTGKVLMEHVWSSHVEPLQKENERLKNDLLDALDLKQGYGPTALSMLQSEITRLKEERDSFAIGFAKWIDKGPYFLHGLTTWKSVDVREPIITDNELIDLYKETLKT